MQLELLMTYHATLKPSQPVGNGPYGNRQIAEVTGGSFEGPKLKGEVLTCGGDWILIDDKGFGHLDVRATFKTQDGAHIYAQYTGVLEFNDKISKAFAEGTGTDYGDNYFMTQPRFETGDERYAWLNNLVTVGEGHIIPNGVEYRLYACRND
jgi:hypothetical protein